MANPILIESIRGKTLESFHRGVICVVNEEGEIVFSIGDEQQICYPRSTMKLFQHLPFLQSEEFKKVNLTPSQLAVMCGSHNGEIEHQKEAESILKLGGLKMNQLQCGGQMPELTKDRVELYKSGANPNHLHNNCSGKHAGFLLYCHLKGWSLENYLDPEHPLQQEIKQVVADLYEYPIEKLAMGRDGCSAPVYSMPIYNQAVSYKNLVSPKGTCSKYFESLQKIVEACTQHPFMVAGNKRYCTQLMEVAGEQVVAKTGADGVYCMGLRKKGWGVSIKIDDGTMGPQYIAAQHLLEKFINLSSDACEKLKEYHTEERYNFSKRHVGRFNASQKLKQALSQL